MSQEAMSSHSSVILSMKVTQTNNKSIGGLARAWGTVPGRPGNSTAGAAAAETRDQLQISNLSTYLAASISGSPAHVAKLSALGTAVSTGQYKVNAGVVSEGLIQHSLLFGGAW
jgi:anti-sigma28 factor (negative regulator of flagellin synthesis)